MTNYTTRQDRACRPFLLAVTLTGVILAFFSILLASSFIKGRTMKVLTAENAYCLAGSFVARVGLMGVLGSLAVCAVIGWACGFPKETTTVRLKVSTFLSRNLLLLSSALCVVTLFVLLLTATLVLQQYPNSADEYAYLFQAQTLARGRLWTPLPPLEHFFSFKWIVEKDSKWVSMYPPGWPALLMLGSLLGLPAWVVNPILGSASIAMLILFATRLEGPVIGLVAALTLAATPFFIFNAASYVSHVPVSLAALLFAYFGARFLASAKAIDALLMGGAIGVIGLTRYYSSILFFGSFLLFLLCTRPRKQLGVFLWIFLGAAPFFAVLLLYNHTITGHALQTVMQWGYPQYHYDLQFPSIHVIRHAAKVIKISAVELTEFSSPLLLLLYGVALAVKASKRSLQFYDFFFMTFVIGYVLWGHDAGNRYGPRYYYDAFPFLILTVISGTHHIISSPKGHIIRNVAMNALTMNVILSLCSLPFIGTNIYKVIAERRDVFRLVEHRGITNAVILLSAGTGVLRPVKSDVLVRNGVEVGGDVIFAHDRGLENCQLQALFPERNVWVYKREPDSVRGRLEPPRRCLGRDLFDDG